MTSTTLGERMGRVEGKIALVTGGASGIGRETSFILAEEGATVVVTDLNGPGAEAVAEEICSRYPGRAVGWQQDVTSPERWQEIISLTSERFSGLDVLVNNAGIVLMATVEQTSYEQWQHLHRVDLDSVFLGCKSAIPLMHDSGGGSIVNIASVAAIVAGAKLAAYNSAKAAVRHFTKSVALHCARQDYNIRCNAVLPSFIRTSILSPLVDQIGEEQTIARLAKQVPLKRIGTPREVAYGVLYLASDESAFMTGSDLVMDGGVSAM